MRLIYDARFTRTQFHDGISRYGSYLLGSALQQAPARGIELTAVISDPAQLRLLPPDVPHLKLSSPVSVQEPLIVAELNRLGADVVFSPMQVLGVGSPLRRRYRLILTLHDLIYYDHPEPPHDLPQALRLAWRAYHSAYWPQRVLLDRADAVAAVSHTTADLIARHRLTRRPVHVIPNAATPPAEPPRRTPGHAARSLVYMGAFLPYKNVETLVRALRKLPGYTLHILSRIAPQREAQLAALAPDGAQVVFHNGVSDEEYHRLIDEATALVTASRAEGFGLPVVEAMARGCPVAVSDLPIFRELAGDAAQYFDPDSPADVARAIRQLEDADAWARAAARGRAEALTYSWDRSAAALLDLAQQLHRDRLRF